MTNKRDEFFALIETSDKAHDQYIAKRRALEKAVWEALEKNDMSNLASKRFTQDEYNITSGAHRSDLPNGCLSKWVSVVVIDKSEPQGAASISGDKIVLSQENAIALAAALSTATNRLGLVTCCSHEGV